MPAHAFADAMARIMARIQPPERIVSSLSAGMDSVVLLHLLVEWRDKNRIDIPIVAAHLNHGLRGAASDLDLSFSRELAQKLDIGFADRTVNVSEIAATEGMGVEEAGRMARYRFFHAVGGGSALTLTGHHADDQVETILLNLRRGAHRRGLSGMRELARTPAPPEGSVLVARPLLSVPRRCLLALAHKRGWRWREDESNASLVYDRNRIRHRVIPILEKILPGFCDGLLEKSSRLAVRERELTEQGMALTDSHVSHEAGGIFFLLDREAFSDPERLAYALRHVVEEESGGRIRSGSILSGLAELGERGRLGETLSLPGNLQARREPDGLFFFFPENIIDKVGDEAFLPVPPFSVNLLGLDITAEWVNYAGSIPETDRIDAGVQWLNADALNLPLRLRPPENGERFHPLGALGARKIQDILVDCKLPRRKRGFSRVLADSDGAIWLWPFRLSQRARLEKVPCRALRMEIREQAKMERRQSVH